MFVQWTPRSPALHEVSRGQTLAFLMQCAFNARVERIDLFFSFCNTEILFRFFFSISKFDGNVCLHVLIVPSYRQVYIWDIQSRSTRSNIGYAKKWI